MLKGTNVQQVKPRWTLRGSWAKKPFCVPQCLFDNGFQPPELPWDPKMRFKQSSIRGERGCSEKRGAVKNE